MQQLTKGANTRLSSAPLAIEVEWDVGSGVVDLDVSALLLGADGHVADDADFVFFNAPRHRSGAVAVDTGSRPGHRSVTADLTRIPPEVHVVALVISADGAAIGDACRVVCTAVETSTGQGLARYALAGTSSETAVLLTEVYRRDAGWKIRAVGQGWVEGLAALATEYGVVVDDTGGAPGAADRAATATGTVELSRAGAVTVASAETLTVRLSWEVARAGRLVPLDAAAVLTDRHGDLVGAVGTRPGEPVPGVAVQPGRPREHVFAVRPADLPAAATVMSFTLTSFGGQRFTEIALAAFEVSAARTTIRGAFDERERRTGLLLLRLERAGVDGWRVLAVGRHADARLGVELVGPS